MPDQPSAPVRHTIKPGEDTVVEIPTQIPNARFGLTMGDERLLSYAIGGVSDESGTVRIRSRATCEAFACAAMSMYSVASKLAGFPLTFASQTSQPPGSTSRSGYSAKTSIASERRRGASQRVDAEESERCGALSDRGRRQPGSSSSDLPYRPIFASSSAAAGSESLGKTHQMG